MSEKLKIPMAASKPAKTLGGWGQGSPITNADLLLLRKAIREGWPVPPEVQRTTIDRLMEEIESDGLSPRRYTAIAKVFLEMNGICIR